MSTEECLDMPKAASAAPHCLATTRQRSLKEPAQPSHLSCHHDLVSDTCTIRRSTPYRPSAEHQKLKAVIRTVDHAITRVLPDQRHFSRDG
ncbi:unnamed protein product, partial [Candidula unifasciata]